MNHRKITKKIAVAGLSALLWSLPLVQITAAQTMPLTPAQKTSNGTALPAGVERVTSVEGITEYKLANGLRVLLFPDQTKQTTTVNITYLVGSKHENYGETGMAHLLEHLVFKGTPKHPNVPAELTAHGAAPNGTTWLDRTNYFETFASTDANLDWALDLEADRMVNSFISKKDLDSEFTVVRNEMESGENDPQGILIQRTMAAAYDWHNYGKDTIGARSDVENVPIDRLQAFYKKYYQPDNAVLTVAGKFDEAKTLAMIQQKFGAIPRPTRELPKTYTAEPIQDGERMVTIRRIGDVKIVSAAYHAPPASAKDAVAVELMSHILAVSPSSRLYKALVETKKASSVSPFNISAKEPGLTMFFAEVNKDGSLETARDSMIETIESFGKTAPTAEEVERVKTRLLKDIDLSFNNPNRIGLSMSEFIASGDWRLFFLRRDRLRTVTPEDVQRAAQKYLKQSNRTVGQFIPTDKPDRSEVNAVSDQEIAALVKDYKGESTIAAGEAFDPTPANIEARTKRSTIGGLKVALMPKENRGDAVFVNMILRFGDAKSLMNRSTAATIAGQMLTRGTTKHTRQQIQDEFNRLKAQAAIGGSATNAVVNIETTRQNLPDVLRLAAEVLREPSFPETEFEQFRQEYLTAIESQRTEPTTVAVQEMGRVFNRYPKGDVRYSSTIDEDIAELKAAKLDDVKKFYKDFYGASNGEIAVVGDFDAPATSALINELFGNWKSPAKFERIPSEYFDIAAVNKSLETPDKSNAFMIARLNLKVRDDNADYPALVLGNFILGGGFLNSRLATRIRQKEGISYGVGSGFNASSLDESGIFTANAIYAPQNAERLEKAFREEIDRMIKEGFTADEIQQAKDGLILSYQRQRGSDSAIASTLRSYLFLNRNFMWQQDLASKIEKLTPEQVRAAMTKYITPDKITIIKAGDFSGAKAKAAPDKQ